MTHRKTFALTLTSYLICAALIVSTVAVVVLIVIGTIHYRTSDGVPNLAPSTSQEAGNYAEPSK